MKQITIRRGSVDTAPTADDTREAYLAPPAPGADSRAWLIWIVGALIPALLTLNPWYQLLVIGVVVGLWISLPSTIADSGSTGLRFSLLIRIALLTLIFGGVFYLFTVHYGDTVLFRLPDSWPFIGGSATLEALTYGLLNGLRLISILWAFALFSRAVRLGDLLRFAPTALFELGLIISIGFTLVPFTLRAFNEIREVQALRGYRPRGLRDLLPLFAPLVTSGMEHALALAESMEARGYGGSAVTHRVWFGQGLGLLGLVGLTLVMTIQTFTPMSLPVLGLMLAGCALSLWAAIRQLSRASARTRLRRGKWGLSEMVVTLGGLLPIIAILLADRSSLVYDPYLAHGWPAFNPWLGLCIMALMLPIVVLPKHAEADDSL